MKDFEREEEVGKDIFIKNVVFVKSAAAAAAAAATAAAAAAAVATAAARTTFSWGYISKTVPRVRAESWFQFMPCHAKI